MVCSNAGADLLALTCKCVACHAVHVCVCGCGKGTSVL